MTQASTQSSAPHIEAAAKAAGLTDWGPQPDAIEGSSESSGRLTPMREGTTTMSRATLP